MTARRASHAISWLDACTIGLFGLSCLVLGGSSRADATTLLVLRPIVVLCLIVFALRVSQAQLAPVRTPLLLLGAFAATIAIQLVPLPAELWASLQGRGTYATELAALGLPAQAHPLSLTPDRTWNSLIALIVPLTMLLGYAVARGKVRDALLPALIFGALLSAVLGIAQFAAGEGALIFSYPAATGVFANRNHEAAFLAIMFPGLRAWVLAGRVVEVTPTEATSVGQGNLIATPRTLIAWSIGLFLVPMILTTGSRAGMVLMLLSLVAAYAIAPVSLPRPKRLAERWTLLVVVTAVSLIVVATIVSGRAIALQRVLASDNVGSDLRIAYLPTMLNLIERFWIFGSGFGSFDPVLRGSEPDMLLHGRYFNNAHNDLIELAMTGGLPSMLVLLAFLNWWRRSAIAAFHASIATAGVATARAAVAMIALLLLASLLDYPLRTPLLGATLALLCAWLASCRFREGDRTLTGIA